MVHPVTSPTLHIRGKSINVVKGWNIPPLIVVRGIEMLTRKMIGSLTLLILFTLLAGCVNKSTHAPIILTINYPSERLFYQKYGHDFENKYPDITIKVVNQDLLENSDTLELDVVYIDQLQLYNQFIDEGKLMNLDSVLQENSYPFSELSPVVQDAVRSKADDSIYGLSPSFISHALFYNKDLFEEFGVPFPSNQMTWSEVFELARRFPNHNEAGERLYGFKSNYYTSIAFSIILRAGQTEGLTFITPKTLKVSFDSAEWKKIFQEVVDSFSKGVIYDQEDSGTGEVEPSPILTGQAAMEIHSNSMAYNFDSYSEFIGASKINWDLVTVPVATRNKDQSDYYDVQEIFSISNTTNYDQESWKLVEFITSNDQNIRNNFDNQLSNALPAKINLIEPIGDHDLSPLYILQPIQYSNDPYDYVHYEILSAFKEVGKKVIEDAIQNTISIDEAIKQIEVEGQQVIDEVKMKFEAKTTKN
ncbi:Bacterial extracellular solute-binding protein [compost metagenome]